MQSASVARTQLLAPRYMFDLQHTESESFLALSYNSIIIVSTLVVLQCTCELQSLSPCPIPEYTIVSATVR